MTDATVVWNQRLRGEIIQNVTVWSNMPTDEAGRQSFVDVARLTWISSGVLNRYIADWTLDSVTFVYNDSLPSFSITVPFTDGPLDGDAPVGGTINQACLLVSTQRIGPPPNRGRIYFGGLSEAGIGASGFWAQAYIDDFEDLVNQWVDGVTYSQGANTAFLRIARRNAQGELTVTNPIDTIVARRNPAVQRRRRIGQGS